MAPRRSNQLRSQNMSPTTYKTDKTVNGHPARRDLTSHQSGRQGQKGPWTALSPHTDDSFLVKMLCMVLSSHLLYVSASLPYVNRPNDSGDVHVHHLQLPCVTIC
jgi:hypothetical protein